MHALVILFDQVNLYTQRKGFDCYLELYTSQNCILSTQYAVRGCFSIPRFKAPAVEIQFIYIQLASIKCDFLKRHIDIWMQLLTKSDQRICRALSKNYKQRHSTK